MYVQWTLSGQLLPLILLQLANGTRKVSSSLSTHEPPTSGGAMQKNTDFTNPYSVAIIELDSKLICNIHMITIIFNPYYNYISCLAILLKLICWKSSCKNCN